MELFLLRISCLRKPHIATSGKLPILRLLCESPQACKKRHCSNKLGLLTTPIEFPFLINNQQQSNTKIVELQYQ
jgi:hypothetical protein